MKNYSENMNDDSGFYNEKAMNELLDKYYEGETSCEEEKMLKQWLSIKEKRDSGAHKPDVAVRSFLDIYLNETNSEAKQVKFSSYRRTFMRVSSAAAVIAVLFGGYRWHRGSETYVTYMNGTKINGSELALLNMQNTLQIISESENIENQLSDIFQDLEY